MFNGVVDHFGESVLPDVEDVCGQITEYIPYLSSPYEIFGKIRLDLEVPVPFDQWGERVDTGAGIARSLESTLFEKATKVLVYGLAGDSELLCRGLGHVGRGFLDVLEDKTPYGVSGGARMGHSLSRVGGMAGGQCW